MPISKLRPSFALTEDRLRELQTVVTKAVGKVVRENKETLS